MTTKSPIPKSGGNGTNSHDPPVTLLLKRISIRSFSGGKKVALYFVQSLNRYISIPYDSKNDILVAEGLFNRLKNKLSHNRQMNKALNKKYSSEKNQSAHNKSGNYDLANKDRHKVEKYQSFIKKYGNRNNIRAAQSDTKLAMRNNA